MYEPQRGRGNLDVPGWDDVRAMEPDDWRFWVMPVVRDNWGQMSLEARSAMASNAAELARKHEETPCAR